MKKVFTLAAVMCLLSFCGCDDGKSSVVITQAEYDQIQIGMTYDQVVAIIGSERTNGPDPRTSGSGVVSCSWINLGSAKVGEFSGAWIQFAGGLVRGKSPMEHVGDTKI